MIRYLLKTVVFISNDNDTATLHKYKTCKNDFLNPFISIQNSNYYV
jgi:hypothetical protein